ncbi:tRNA lysidine(34) synthetase TilS [Thermodesulfobacteriota bacterium]
MKTHAPEDALILKVKRAIALHSMIENGQGVVVGVSGGPDSVAMLHILNELEAESHFRMIVAHLDHSLRPESAKEACFVHDLASNLGIETVVKRVDVKAVAEEKGVSIEEAGRVARYDFFEEVRGSVGAEVIATAHHIDDAVETFFLRVFRGASLTGLRGIAPKRGTIIRPLCDASRSEILAYLEHRALPYLTDPTNLTEDTDRNFVRNRIIPVIEERFPNFAVPLHRTLELVREDERLMQQTAADLYLSAVSRQDDGLRLDVPIIAEAPESIASRTVKEALYKLSGPEIRWQRLHIRNILKLIRGGNPSAGLTLPGGLWLQRRYDYAMLTTRKPKERPPLPTLSVPGPGTFEITQAGIILEFRSFRYNESLPTDIDGKSIALFDGDEIEFPLTIRPPSPGDRFKPWGLEGSRKLKKVLGEMKIPAASRSRTPLVVKGDTILWVPGIGRGQAAPIHGGTRNVLEMRLVEV